MRMDVVGSSILPWVAGSLYVLGLVAIPLYSWLPWMALHNQREYTGGNRWVPAVAILWAIAAISFHFLRKGMHILRPTYTSYTTYTHHTRHTPTIHPPYTHHTPTIHPPYNQSYTSNNTTLTHTLPTQCLLQTPE